MYENTGILSRHEIFLPHFGQSDLPEAMLIFLGRRYVKDVKNDPIIKPIIATKNIPTKFINSLYIF